MGTQWGCKWGNGKGLQEERGFEKFWKSGQGSKPFLKRKGRTPGNPEPFHGIERRSPAQEIAGKSTCPITAASSTGRCNTI
jgi:hypothetical protein